jgi:hypothetical protein
MGAYCTGLNGKDAHAEVGIYQQLAILDILDLWKRHAQLRLNGRAPRTGAAAERTR